MIPTYCITLRQTPERHKLAKQHLADAGLDVVMFLGIHAPTFGIVTTKQAYPTKDDYTIASGQVGCLLSHYMVWQYALMAGHEEVLILEDDANLVDDFEERFLALKKQLPNDWQFCYVGHLVKDEAAPRIEKTRYEHGTHAYMVKKETLEILLKTNQEARTHCDLQVGENSLPHLIAYRMMPSLVGQMTQDTSRPWQTTTNHLALTAVRPGEFIMSENSSKDVLILRMLAMVRSMGGWCDEQKALWMIDSMIENRPQICIEIGVFEGKSFFVQAMALRYIGTGKIYGVDAWEASSSVKGANHPANMSWWGALDHSSIYRKCVSIRENLKLEDWCEVIRSDSISEDTLNRFEDGSVDWFHLDGNHGVGKPLADMKAWLPKLSHKATIVLDDPMWNEAQVGEMAILTVQEAVMYLKSQGWKMLNKYIPNCVVMVRE